MEVSKKILSLRKKETVSYGEETVSNSYKINSTN